jgi:hypothetical protein
MPVFFFSQREDGYIIDEAGTELKNLSDARRHAIEIVERHIDKHPENAWNHEKCTVDVWDMGGVLLFSVVVEASRTRSLERLS